MCSGQLISVGARGGISEHSSLRFSDTVFAPRISCPPGNRGPEPQELLTVSGLSRPNQRIDGAIVRWIRLPGIAARSANSRASLQICAAIWSNSRPRLIKSNPASVRAKVGDGNSTVHEGCSLSLAGSTAMPRVNVLGSLVEGVILSWGWRRRAIAFVSGAVGALAMPPFPCSSSSSRRSQSRSG